MLYILALLSCTENEPTKDNQDNSQSSSISRSTLVNGEEISVSNEINYEELSDKKLEEYISKYTWIPEPWALNMYVINETTFNNGNGKYYWGTPMNDGIESFQYVIRNREIVVENTIYTLKKNDSINGPVALAAINSEGKEYRIYPKELRDFQVGKRKFEQYEINWGDVNESALNGSDIYEKPEAKNPIAFNGSEALVYCLNDFEKYKYPFYVTTIKWLGSIDSWGQKWYLGYRYRDTGDKDGQDVDFIWSLGYPVSFPSLVYKYYDAINNGKMEVAYSIWHKKQSFEYFKELYSNINKILPTKVNNNGNNSWTVETVIEFNDSTKKVYQVNFQLSDTNIINSTSTEIEYSE